MNLFKHGYSLEDAKVLWVQFAAEWPANYSIEKRWLRVGWIEGKMFTCVFTYRSKRVRLISLRRSRENEIIRYDQEKPKDEKEKT